MRHVAVSHDRAVIAHLGRPAVFTTPVDGHKLADRGVVADLHGGILAFVFEILRNTGDHRTGEDPAVFADAGAFHDRHITADPGAFADLHILVDDAERSTFTFGPVWHSDVCMCGWIMGLFAVI